MRSKKQLLTALVIGNVYLFYHSAPRYWKNQRPMIFSDHNKKNPFGETTDRWSAMARRSFGFTTHMVMKISGVVCYI